jgi:ribosomal protein S12 methylthiotransferase
MQKKIGIVSLGCTKNRVDTENMLELLQQEGYMITNDPQEADAVIVNTCGFIQDAKQESINTILEMAELKEQGFLRALIVTGCLSQRYKEDLAQELPEVDAFLGVANYARIAETVNMALTGKKTRDFERTDGHFDYGRRVLTTAPHLAYIKIAEGCDNCCSYCAIPMIRGPLKSRPMEDILAEAQALAGRGVKEAVLIAQDTTKYGLDIYKEPRLAELLRAIAGIRGFDWIRVLYSYPESITDELLDAMAENKKICKYIDMPVQHLSDGILRRMNRRSNRETILDAVRRIREKSDDFILRTTIITGFPGETEEDHKALLEGIETIKFDRLGVFRYSREEGTKAATLEGQVHAAVKKRRLNEIMRLQARISEEKNEVRVGRVYPVLVEGMDDVSKMYYGRSYAEAPEIDGKIFIRTKKRLTAGTFHDVVITEGFDYDLMGELTE